MDSAIRKVSASHHVGFATILDEDLEAAERREAVELFSLLSFGLDASRQGGC